MQIVRMKKHWYCEDCFKEMGVDEGEIYCEICREVIEDLCLLEAVSGRIKQEIE